MAVLHAINLLEREEAYILCLCELVMIHITSKYYSGHKLVIIGSKQIYSIVYQFCEQLYSS